MHGLCTFFPLKKRVILNNVLELLLDWYMPYNSLCMDNNNEDMIDI